MDAAGHCHNIIIEMKDYLIVDANYTSGAKLVIEDVKKPSSKPIKYVIDTPAHSDTATATRCSPASASSRWLTPA